jgi:two-component system sensor histidine kinase BaeS
MRAELEGMLDGLIPVGRQEIQSLHDETGRLQRMLEGMEELAHAQGSALTLRKQPVALKPLLQNIVERVRRNLGDRDVRVTLACSDDLVLSADPDKLSQVVINVLANAVKAVGERGTVGVTASTDREQVVLAVADDGVGIAPADQPFIFERFYRRAHGGLGVGLAIVKELLEAHGGTVAVESQLGKGSVFTMRFPP